MAVFKCKMCGANLPVIEGATVAKCEYCGTQQTLPANHDERIVGLFNRANHLRSIADFDKAQETYEHILEYDNTLSEAHWGVVLCKYGIEYVENPNFNECKPTCHRTQPQSILADNDYMMAIRYATPLALPIYEREAKQINEIQKRILSIVKNETPYDVFICYKERAEDGTRTHDSVIASDIYHQLTNNGFNVFFAAITLENKLGEEYEPFIYAALSSAKVMIVLGTKPEYFLAPWVRNEWSRYLHLMQNDREKTRILIPCYKDMDAYDLPAEFAHLQALNMGNIAFIVDLVNAIHKLCASGSKEETKNTNQSVVDEYVARAHMLIAEGDYTKATGLLEAALNYDDHCALAYAGKALIGFNKNYVGTGSKNPTLHSIEDFSKIPPRTLKFFSNIEKAMQYSTGETRERMMRILGETYYGFGMDEERRGNYADAKKYFDLIIGYKDAQELSKECCYKLGKDLDKRGKYDRALEAFQQIPGYKDADAMIERCKRGLQLKEDRKSLGIFGRLRKK